MNQINQTSQTHLGLPVFQSAFSRCFSFCFTPAYLDGAQVGFLQEVIASDRGRVELKKKGWSGFELVTESGWTGD